MKNLFKTFAALAASLLAFNACQQEVVPVEPKHETHTITVIAGNPETKTTATVDGTGVEYSWNKSDEESSKWFIFENGVPAEEIEASLDEDKDEMIITATFDGHFASADATYTGYFNKGVRASQENNDELKYDQYSDVLVAGQAKVQNGSVVFQFKREIALGQMTLKNLAAGEFVSNVTIESLDGTILAADYDLANKAFSSNGSESISITTLAEIDEENRTAVVRFATVPTPAEGARLKISVTTIDSDEKVVGKYVKELARELVLSRGDLKAFNVALTADYLDPHMYDEGWFLVKDVRALSVGDEIRIGCATALDGDKNPTPAVAGAIEGTNTFLSLRTAEYEEDQMVAVNSPETFTLSASEGNWVLTSNSGVLGSNGDKKITFNEEASGYVGTWTILISAEGVATIASTNTDFGRILCNSSSPRFVNYKTSNPNSTGTMTLPGIYKKYGDPTDGNVKQAQTISFSPKSYTATIGAENTYPVLTCQSTGAKEWSSSDQTVATIDAETGEITLVAEGETTITVSVAGDENYKAGEGSYVLTVNPAPIVSGDKWYLVSDASGLSAGDEIIITNIDATLSLGTKADGNNRPAVDVASTALDKSYVEIGDNIQTILLSGEADAWVFNVGENSYLAATGGTRNNYLKTVSTLDDMARWSISVNSSTKAATITAKHSSTTRNTVFYNGANGSSLFSCYTSSSTYTTVAIYKKEDSRSEQTVKFQLNDVDVTSAMNATVGAAFSEPTLVKQSTGAVTFESSNTAVATVNATTGEVTPLKKGSVRITANVEGDDDYRSGSAYYDINVANVLESIALANDSAQPKTFEIDDEFSFDGIKVVATYNDQTTAEVSSSDLSFSGFDSSAAAASQEITVSYTENDVTRTTTYNVQIIAPVVRYDITLPEVSAGNSISVVGGQTSVQENSEVTLQVNLATGYYLTSLKVNGTEVKESVADNKYTFTITSDVTVTASFSNLYTVTFTPNPDNGSVTVNSNSTGSVQVAAGADVTLVGTAGDAQHEFDSWTVTPAQSFKTGTASTSTAVFTMPAANVEVIGSFREKSNYSAQTLKFTYSSHNGWTVSNATDNSNGSYYILKSGASIVSPEIEYSQITSITVKTRTYGGASNKTTAFYLGSSSTSFGSVDADNTTLTDKTAGSESNPLVTTKGKNNIKFESTTTTTQNGPGVSEITINYIGLPVETGEGGDTPGGGGDNPGGGETPTGKDYTNAITSFTTNSLTSGWTTNGSFNSSYYKMTQGQYAQATSAALFAEQVLSTDMKINVACGTFGSWSNPKTITLKAVFYDSSNNELSSQTFTTGALDSTQGTYRGEFTLSKPSDPSKIAYMRIIFNTLNGGTTGRLAGVKLTYSTVPR